MSKKLIKKLNVCDKITAVGSLVALAGIILMVLFVVSLESDQIKWSMLIYSLAMMISGFVIVRYSENERKYSENKFMSHSQLVDLRTSITISGVISVISGALIITGIIEDSYLMVTIFVLITVVSSMVSISLSRRYENILKKFRKKGSNPI